MLSRVPHQSFERCDGHHKMNDLKEKPRSGGLEVLGVVLASAADTPIVIRQAHHVRKRIAAYVVDLEAPVLTLLSTESDPPAVAGAVSLHHTNH
jgi:hypothetical protein